MDIKASSLSCSRAHTDGIWSVDWQGDFIITGSLDGQCKLWTVNDSEVSHVATSSTKSDMGVQSVSMTKDGTNSIACSQDGDIRIFGEDMKETGKISAGILEAWDVCISPDNDAIASGNQEGKIKFWATATLDFANSMDTGGEFISNLTFDSKGTNIGTSHMDGYVRIYDLVAQSVAVEMRAHHLPARQVVFSQDDQLVYSCSDDRHVYVFDRRTETPVNSFSHAGMALCMDVSPDMRHFVVGCADHSVQLWDLGMQRQIKRMDTYHSDQVWDLKYSPNGKMVVSVGDDALLQFYEVC
jgi:WD40 repeat protein